MLEAHIDLCVTEPDFLGKFFLRQKLGKWAKNEPKAEFFKYIEKLCH